MLLIAPSLRSHAVRLAAKHGGTGHWLKQQSSDNAPGPAAAPRNATRSAGGMLDAAAACGDDTMCPVGCALRITMGESSHGA